MRDRLTVLSFVAVLGASAMDANYIPAASRSRSIRCWLCDASEER
jgi:hypothetical protein